MGRDSITKSPLSHLLQKGELDKRNESFRRPVIARSGFLRRGNLILYMRGVCFAEFTLSQHLRFFAEFTLSAGT